MGYQKREMWFFQHRNNIGQWETTGPLPPCESSTIQQQDTMTRHNIRLHGIQINSPSQQCRKMVLECLLTYDVLMHGIMIPSEEGYWNISSNIPNKEILLTAMENANDRRSSKVWCFGQSKTMQQQNTMTLKILWNGIQINSNSLRQQCKKIPCSHFSSFPDTHRHVENSRDRDLYFYLSEWAVMGRPVTTSLSFNGNLHLLDGSPVEQEVIAE